MANVKERTDGKCAWGNENSHILLVEVQSGQKYGHHYKDMSKI